MFLGQGSRTPVAIMLLVRDPAHRGECQIHYKDIGDYSITGEEIANRQGESAPLPASPTGNGSRRMNTTTGWRNGIPGISSIFAFGFQRREKQEIGSARRRHPSLFPRYMLGWRRLALFLDIVTN